MRIKWSATALTSVMLAIGPVAAKADSLVVVGWGGSLSAAEAEAFDKPFAQQKGTKIVNEVYNGGLAQVKAQVESGKVTWDVLDAQLSDAEQGCTEGLLEKIPSSALADGPAGEKPEADFLPGALHDCGVANYVWANVFAYNKESFPNGGPQTIADIFDLEKFPGKRGLAKSPKANLEWALLADGVPADKVYETLGTPEGVDRAFAKLGTIKNQVIWWEAGAQPPQLLADGEVSITAAYNGRLFDAIVKEKKPYQLMWDGQVWAYGAFIIPKGAPNRDKALEYVAFATSAAQLADLTQYITYGPARQSALKLVPDELKSQLPTAEENFTNALQQDDFFWADHGDELQERFNAWLGSN